MMKPTPEQFAEWLAEAKEGRPASELRTNSSFVLGKVAHLAYAAGADFELERCCEWMEFQERLPGYLANDLRKARRPEPPSLKEKALAEMELLETHGINASCLGTLRRAIESLPDP
jgi:hypothetical protein